MEQSDEDCSDEERCDSAYTVPSCIVDAESNLMPAGADRCTGLNSDEDPDLQEEPEEEEDDDSWDGDWDIGELTDDESDSDCEELPDSIWLSAAKNPRTIASMRDVGWEYDPSKFGPDPSYADLYDGPYGPSDSVLSVAEDPLALLFYFLPPKLRAQIAVESNCYHNQSIPLRARSLRSQQRRNGGEVEELGKIRRRLAAVEDIKAWEVLPVVALLIARMLVPIRRGIAAHWSVRKVGALPANRFGNFMGKNRFFHVMGYLHFSNNKSPQARLDRAWNIRSVIDVLQRTFARGYNAPPVISFDEATLPSRSRYNLMRQFHKDKPHRWGTKVFVAACAKTAYCMRIEVYCGAKAHLRTPVPKDNNSGEDAVLRNMNALLAPSPTSPWRLVVTDRFYTSVKLALELLHRHLYLTGTIKTDRSGLLLGKKKRSRCGKNLTRCRSFGSMYWRLFGTKRIVNMDNYYTSVQLLQEPELKGLYGWGTIKTNSKHFPRHTILDDTKCTRDDLRQAISRGYSMIAASWCDGDVVNMVSNADASTITPATRMVGSTSTEFAAPTCIGEYNQNMQGVDRLVQIRGRFSIADGHSYKRWHKKLALALIDIARLNAYLTRRLAKPDLTARDPHRQFVMDLASELMNGKCAEAPSEGRMIYGARLFWSSNWRLKP